MLPTILFNFAYKYLMKFRHLVKTKQWHSYEFKINNDQM